MLARIYRWWLSGYPSEVLSEMLKSAKKGSLKEKLIKEILTLRGRTPILELDDHIANHPSKRIKNLPKEVLKYTKGWELTPEEALEKAYEILEEITKGHEPSLEQENMNEKPRVLTSKTPSRRELEALKKALGITKGSIQYKKRGDGIYLVTYNPSKKGYDWNHLGRWSDLKKLIYPKSVTA